MKPIYNKILNWIPGILLTFILITRLLISNRFSFKYGELFFLIILSLSLLLLYNIFKKKYTGMAVFSVLTFLLLGFLPYCHYLCYSSNKNNYSFNSEYITQRVNNSRQELKYYKDSTSIKELLVNLKSIDFDLKFNYGVIGKKQFVQNYIFILTQYNRKWYHISSLPIPKNYPFGETNKFIIYKGNKKFKFEMINENLVDELIYFQNQKNLLQNKIKYPKQFVPFSDIWLDSVTGFIFAFIKPLSTTSQLIRLFQLISAYFFFNMISSWIKQSKGLNIEKIQ